MGVHVSLVSPLTGEEDPRWDWTRHAGDRLIERALLDLGAAIVPHPRPELEEDALLSLADSSGVRDLMTSLVAHEYGSSANEDRWELLQSLLSEGLLASLSR